MIARAGSGGGDVGPHWADPSEPAEEPSLPPGSGAAVGRWVIHRKRRERGQPRGLFSGTAQRVAVKLSRARMERPETPDCRDEAMPHKLRTTRYEAKPRPGRTSGREGRTTAGDLPALP